MSITAIILKSSNDNTQVFNACTQKTKQKKTSTTGSKENRPVYCDHFNFERLRKSK
jgi:hypothetical protein